MLSLPETIPKAEHPRDQSGGEAYYDLFDDYDLIESSFLKQYGIRLRANDDMSWNEFCTLLSGLMNDTPLGQIVSIRAEKDRNVIKDFTPEQKRIRREWILKRNQKLKENPVEYKKYVDGLHQWAMQFARK